MQDWQSRPINTIDQKKRGGGEDSREISLPSHNDRVWNTGFPHHVAPWGVVWKTPWQKADLDYLPRGRGGVRGQWPLSTGAACLWRGVCIGKAAALLFSSHTEHSNKARLQVPLLLPSTQGNCLDSLCVFTHLCRCEIIDLTLWDKKDSFPKWAIDMCIQMRLSVYFAVAMLKVFIISQQAILLWTALGIFNTIHMALWNSLLSCSQFFQVIRTYIFHPFPPSTNLSTSRLLPMSCPVPKETGSEGHMVSVSRAGGSYERLSRSWATWPLRRAHTQTATGNVTKRATKKVGGGLPKLRSGIYSAYSVFHSIISFLHFLDTACVYYLSNKVWDAMLYCKLLLRGLHNAKQGACIPFSNDYIHNMTDFIVF